MASVSQSKKHKAQLARRRERHAERMNLSRAASHVSGCPTKVAETTAHSETFAVGSLATLIDRGLSHADFRRRCFLVSPPPPGAQPAPEGYVYVIHWADDMAKWNLMPTVALKAA